MGALLIINEFDDIFGKILLIRLKVFNYDVLTRDDFMVFEVS